MRMFLLIPKGRDHSGCSVEAVLAVMQQKHSVHCVLTAAWCQKSGDQDPEEL